MGQSQVIRHLYSTLVRTWRRRSIRTTSTFQLFQNGQLRQNSNTAQLIFDCYRLVSFISTNLTLLTGDIILTVYTQWLLADRIRGSPGSAYFRA